MPKMSERALMQEVIDDDIAEFTEMAEDEQIDIPGLPRGVQHLVETGRIGKINLTVALMRQFIENEVKDGPAIFREFVDEVATDNGVPLSAPGDYRRTAPRQRRSLKHGGR